MRPPVSVPTLSRRAKLVIGAIAVLLVLFTAIGTLTNVYVDYLWFDETGFTEVFWTELQTRALLFAVATRVAAHHPCTSATRRRGERGRSRPGPSAGPRTGRARPRRAGRRGSSRVGRGHGRSPCRSVASRRRAVAGSRS